MAKPPADGKLVVASYRKAFHHYEILEELEAGLSLMGPEVKSLREGKASMDGSFARVEGREVFLHNLYLPPYKQNTSEEIPPTRPRKLLLHAREIEKLLAKQQVKGLSLIPLEIYFKGGWAKVRLALAKGKRGPDKRESIKKRETERELERGFKGRFKA
jgi:SsrA-binding protein